MRTREAVDSPQLELLNEFVGLPEPSERLVTLAYLQSLARADYEENPLVIASKAKAGMYVSRAVEAAETGRPGSFTDASKAITVLAAMALQTLPSLLRLGVATQNFRHQLEEEYGEVIVRPSSLDTNRSSIHPRHSAASLVNFAVFDDPTRAGFD